MSIKSAIGYGRAAAIGNRQKRAFAVQVSEITEMNGQKANKKKTQEKKMSRIMGYKIKKKNRSQKHALMTPETKSVSSEYSCYIRSLYRHIIMAPSNRSISLSCSHGQQNRRRNTNTIKDDENILKLIPKSANTPAHKILCNIVFIV